MQFNPAVYDLWVFRRCAHGVEFLVLRLPDQGRPPLQRRPLLADYQRRFPERESVPAAVDRELAPYGLTARAVWAAEHTYTIYNRRFDEIEIISVFAVETDGTAPVQLNPEAIRSMNGCPMKSRSHVSTSAA